MRVVATVDQRPRWAAWRSTILPPGGRAAPRARRRPEKRIEPWPLRDERAALDRRAGRDAQGDRADAVQQAAGAREPDRDLAAGAGGDGHGEAAAGVGAHAAELDLRGTCPALHAGNHDRLAGERRAIDRGQTPERDGPAVADPRALVADLAGRPATDTGREAIEVTTDVNALPARSATATSMPSEDIENERGTFAVSRPARSVVFNGV